MKSKAEEYVDHFEFLEFLNREFDKTAVNGTIEELAEFAFGGSDEAVQAFEESK